jgi:Protein of unknown function (DUF2384)
MAVKSRMPKTDRLSAPGLRAFFAIADHWMLDNEERRILLGSVPESTFYKYASTPESARLSRDTLERISHLIGIFKSLNVLLPRPEQADAWVKRANEAALFKGRSALEFMLSGRFEDLIAVRHYVDTARGW